MLPLRHPGHAHPLNRVVAPGKRGGIVMPRAGGITKAANSEARIERKSRSHCGSCFVQLPEQRQRGREIEMPNRIVRVCVEAPTQPDNCFGIGIEVHLGKASNSKPSVDQDVPR